MIIRSFAIDCHDSPKFLFHSHWLAACLSIQEYPPVDLIHVDSPSGAVVRFSQWLRYIWRVQASTSECRCTTTIPTNYVILRADACVRASVRFAADSEIGFPSQNAMNETHEYNLFEIIRMRWWWFCLNVNSRQQSNKRVERHSCYRKWRVRVCSFLSTVVVIFVSPVFVLCRRPPFRRW